jgi:formylglycine-generating enzyme required for sulfatase activity
MIGSRGAALCLALLAAAGGARGESCPAGLTAALGRVDAADPDMRVRARREAREIFDRWLRERAPSGMRLVHGRVEISAAGVRCVGGFYLAEREVTVGEFRAYLAATGRRTRAELSAGDAYPVAGVDLEEARAFAAWRGGRLPTSEELRAAATVRGRCRYPWGDTFDPSRCNTRESGLGRALPAGSLAGGESVEGCRDLVGNVAEWTETFESKGNHRLHAAVGGSWLRLGRGAHFVTYRLPAEARYEDVGFRLAASLPEHP